MVIIQILATLSRWCRARRTARELSELDDRALLDIGLLRSQIVDRAKRAAL